MIQFFTRSPKCLKHVRAYVEKADVMDSCHQMPDAALHVFTPSVLWEHLLVQARLDLAAELHCWHVRPRLPPPPPPPLPRTVTKVLLTTIGTETRLPPGGLLKVIPQPGWSSLLSNLSEIKPMPMPVCSESPFTDYTMTQHVKDTLRQIAPCHTYQEWNGWGSIDKHSGSVASLNGLLQFKLDIFG